MLIGEDFPYESFGIKKPLSTYKTQSLFGDIFGERSVGSEIILLGPRSTLYQYGLPEVCKFYDSLEISSLSVLCSGLSEARGSGERRWINTQQGESNFNMNLFKKIPRIDNPWQLQEKIAISVIDTIEYFSGQQADIAYPFHYLQHGGKVAGHLLQQLSYGDISFIRIGLGINTGEQVISLPKNDQLQGNLYARPTSIHLLKSRWIEVAQYFRGRVEYNLGLGCHNDYQNRLALSPGDMVTIYKDNGTIQFGDRITEGVFRGVSEAGVVTVGDMILEKKDFHISKSPSK